LALKFADQRRSLSRYSSLADYRPRSLFYLHLLLLLLFVCSVWNSITFVGAKKIGTQPAAVRGLSFSVYPSRRSLELSKIWGFHGGDYEERRLLGYKTLVRTSQETHYFSATEPSQLMLCKILRFHSLHYEECRLLGCYAVCLF
jgi:hypothetical protein